MILHRLWLVLGSFALAAEVRGEEHSILEAAAVAVAEVITVEMFSIFLPTILEVKIQTDYSVAGFWERSGDLAKS